MARFPDREAEIKALAQNIVTGLAESTKERLNVSTLARLHAAVAPTTAETPLCSPAPLLPCLTLLV